MTSSKRGRHLIVDLTTGYSIREPMSRVWNLYRLIDRHLIIDLTTPLENPRVEFGYLYRLIDRHLIIDLTTTYSIRESTNSVWNRY